MQNQSTKDGPLTVMQNYNRGALTNLMTPDEEQSRSIMSTTEQYSKMNAKFSVKHLEELQSSRHYIDEIYQLNSNTNAIKILDKNNKPSIGITVTDRKVTNSLP
jgi:hypothetical protein